MMLRMEPLTSVSSTHIVTVWSGIVAEDGSPSPTPLDHDDLDACVREGNRVLRYPPDFDVDVRPATVFVGFIADEDLDPDGLGEPRVFLTRELAVAAGAHWISEHDLITENS